LEAGRNAEAAGTLRIALGLWRGQCWPTWPTTRTGGGARLERCGWPRPGPGRADLALGPPDRVTDERDQWPPPIAGERLHGQLMLEMSRAADRRRAWPPTACPRYARRRAGVDNGEPMRGGKHPSSPTDQRLTGTATADPPGPARPAPRFLPGAGVTMPAARGPREPPAGGGAELLGRGLGRIFFFFFFFSFFFFFFFFFFFLFFFFLLSFFFFFFSFFFFFFFFFLFFFSFFFLLFFLFFFFFFFFFFIFFFFFFFFFYFFFSLFFFFLAVAAPRAWSRSPAVGRAAGLTGKQWSGPDRRRRGDGRRPGGRGSPDSLE